MRIRSLQIKGFGILHDTGVRNMPPGLNIFTGDNESGKSTLMRFIRAVLFGIQGKTPRDEPLMGGSHGGTLELELDNGDSLTFELRNRKVKVTGSDGHGGEHVKAPDIFGGVDRQIFERIFAVGLEDLYSYGDALLDAEKIRNRLFAAGAGLGDVSISRIFTKLERDMQQLAKNRSSRSRSAIKDDSDKLIAIEKKLAELSSLQDEYADLNKEKEILSRERDEISREIGSLENRQIELKRILSLLEPFSRLKGIRKEISHIESRAGELPPGAFERFSDIKKNISFYKGELARNDREMESVNLETDGLRINHHVLSYLSELESLREDRTTLTSLGPEIVFQKGKLENFSSDLSRQLSQIAPDWGEEDLVKADTSLASGREALELIDRFDLLEKERMEYELLSGRAKEDLENILADLTAAKDVLSGFGEDAETVEEVSGSIETMKKAEGILLSMSHIQENIQVLEDALEENNERLESMDSMVVNLRSEHRKEFFMLLAVFFPGGILASQYFFDSFHYSFFFLFSAACVSIFFCLWKLMEKKNRRYIEKIEMEKARMLLRIRKDKGDLSMKEGALDVLNEELIACFESIGLDSDPGAYELEKRKLMADMRLARARERESATRRVYDIHEKFRKQSENLAILEDKLLRKKEELEKWQRTWDGYLAGKNLPVNVKPGFFQILIQAIKSAHKTLSGKMEILARVEQLTEAEHEAHERIDNIISSCGLSFKGDMAEKIAFLLGQLKENLEGENRRILLERKKEELLFQRKELGEKTGSLLLQQKELMERSNASTEDVFFSRIEEHSRLQELRNLEMEIVARLTGLAGNETLLENISGKLDDMDTLDLELEMKNNLERTGSLFSKREDIIASLAKTEIRLQEISFEGTQSRLLQEKECLLARCRDNSLKWASYAVCRGILEKARENYELQKQPQVVKLASRYMQTITGGRYGIMCSSVSRKIFLWEDKNLSRKGSTEWSSGLADQAYLAIRLAVSSMFSGSAGCMPLVLDDIHLRFDPERQRNLAEVLLEHSRYQQTLFFSCNPSFADMIPSVSGEFHGTAPAVYRIEEGRIRERSTGAC